MSTDPSRSPISPMAQHWVRPGLTTDAPLLDAWLMTLAPLPVPEARARRVALEALLVQGGHGLCLMVGEGKSDVDGTTSVRALLPVSLVHSLSTGGRAAFASEWWTTAELGTEGNGDKKGAKASDWLVACCDMLADWCRAHGIRHVLLAPGVVADVGTVPPGFVAGPDGLWHRSLVPAPKILG
ncbi:hypothetical protein [Cupriavidus sp. RAF12]|uniref:hypothetical protein n=1 Tax=Cupriavidus sp. RAF12 TaxID=3233050 RepID=UPI003F92F5A4